MAGFLDTLVNAVRRISTALRPDILGDLGLIAAIVWQLQEVCQRTGLTYELALPAEDLTVEPARATAIFRIFQEALTNVLRHAAASQVTVRMLQQPQTLTLEVIDNGKGITPRQLADRDSLGLLSSGNGRNCGVVTSLSRGNLAKAQPSPPGCRMRHPTPTRQRHDPRPNRR